MDPSDLLNQTCALPTLRTLHTPGALEHYRSCVAQQWTNPHVRAAFMELLGKLEAFDDLLAVDWLMDVSALKRGNLEAAVTKFQAQYVARSRGIDLLRISTKVEDDNARR
jgi:hypothetical protein